MRLYCSHIEHERHENHVDQFLMTFWGPTAILVYFIRNTVPKSIETLEFETGIANLDVSKPIQAFIALQLET